MTYHYQVMSFAPLKKQNQTQTKKFLTVFCIRGHLSGTFSIPTRSRCLAHLTVLTMDLRKAGAAQPQAGDVEQHWFESLTWQLQSRAAVGWQCHLGTIWKWGLSQC